MGPGPSNNNNNNNNGGGGGGGMSIGSGSAPFPYNIPPNPVAPPPCPSMGPSTSTSSSSNEKKDMNFNTAFNAAFIQEEAGASGRDTTGDVNIPPPSYDSLSPDDNLAASNKPKPQPRSKMSPTAQDSSMPDLPNVPLDLPDIPDDTNNEEIDFDDLSKRFEALKKRK